MDIDEFLIKLSETKGKIRWDLSGFTEDVITGSYFSNDEGYSVLVCPITGVYAILNNKTPLDCPVLTEVIEVGSKLGLSYDLTNIIYHSSDNYGNMKNKEVRNKLLEILNLTSKPGAKRHD